MSGAAANTRDGSPRSLVIEADGGSRGNPGVAGYGALVRDSLSGAVLVELAEPLGTVSNNVAEYSGLIAGLRAVLELDAGAEVVARLDSKLVVEQMADRWKIKHEDMRRLALVARDLCAEISAAGGSVGFEWVPREKNKAADALSNEGMDGHSVRRVPSDCATAAPDREQPDEREYVDRADDAAAVVREALRLVLVQYPDGPAQATAVSGAVAGLVGHPRVVAADTPSTQSTRAALASALGLQVENDRAWHAPPGRGPDVTTRAAYEDLVRIGGEVVVLTSRRGVLTVLADVLGIPLERFWALASAPGSLTGVEVWPDGTASVAFTNRTDHLG